MIDAPDHAAQERGNRSTGAWLLVALLGIALSVVAGMMSYGYTAAQAEQRFADVVDYVATQSLSYDAFNSAYATKNLIRVMEIAGEAARDMERDGSDNAMLEQYADQFPESAPIERWKSTLQSLRLMDSMNKSTNGSDHKNRLEKLQSQTAALFDEIFQTLDSGNAQIKG